MPLPTGFTAIKDATGAGTAASFIGVIVSIKEQRKTKGTDWVYEFTIQDDFSAGVDDGASSISCRIFRPAPALFPKISGVGDIAIIRNFRLDAWNGSYSCIFTVALRSGVLIFPSSKIPAPELSQPYQLGGQMLMHSSISGTKEPTAQEQAAVIQLKHTASASLPQITQHATTSLLKATKKDRLSLIKDLDFNSFYDIRAQIVNIYWNNFGSVELKVTDYTSNKDLFLYAEPDDPDNWYPKSWKGPYGQLTLDVRLYGNNGTYTRDNLLVGDFVFLRNMHTKMSPANKLEGVLHEDKQQPNKVDISKLLNQVDINEIKQRQETYEQNRSKKSAFEELGNVPKKASAKASAKKKAEKKARQRLQKEEEQKSIAEQAEKWEADRTGVNLNVRAAFPEIQLSTISDIIFNPHLKGQTPIRYNDFTLPFVNCRHRTRVRVVDFFPPELELFAHHTGDPAWVKRARPQDEQQGQIKGRWEWGFMLLLEDAKLPPNTVSEKLRVVVGNEAGQHLLDMDARDLKGDSRTLKRLEEKLFILWGNLLELKVELRDRGTDLPLPPGDNRLQNKPFDCCIEEYGHEVHVSEKNPAGYQRMHRLAGTKIQSEM